MCTHCGNPECPGSGKLQELLAGMKTSELAAVLTGSLHELAQQVGESHPAYKHVRMAEELFHELVVRLAELSIANALREASLGASAGIGLAGAGYALGRTSRTPRGRQSQPLGKVVLRRFRPPKEKKS